MMPYLEGRFGNPSSGHWFGVKEKQAVAAARADVATLIGADPSEITFTSGGTESVNWAIKGTCLNLPEGKGRHLVTSRVEHVVVLECAKFLEERHGFEVTYVGCDAEGRVSPDDVAAAIRADTALVSIMHANNETGTLNDIAAIARICRDRKVLFHTDASQSIGKVRVDVKALQEVDMLTIAGHKLYAPPGIGALYVRAGTPLGTWMHGAGQEGGRRAGTESVLMIVALGAAARAADGDQDAKHAALARSRDLLHTKLLDAVPDLALNGSPQHRLPNTLNVSFPARLPTSARLLAAVAADVAASAGSACHSDRVAVSHVLAAMGCDETRAARAVRFSTGRATSDSDIERAAAAVVAAVARGA